MRPLYFFAYENLSNNMLEYLKELIKAEVK